jgi:hypothetical protein
MASLLKNAGVAGGQKPLISAPSENKQKIQSRWLYWNIQKPRRHQTPQGYVYIDTSYFKGRIHVNGANDELIGPPRA